MTSPLGPLAPLGGRRFERIANVLLLGEAASTNDVARALVERMVAEETDILPTCIVARRQTAGKGRSGRTWVTAGEGAVAVSLVAPWPEGPERIHVPVATGISLARSLSRAFGVDAAAEVAERPPRRREEGRGHPRRGTNPGGRRRLRRRRPRPERRGHAGPSSTPWAFPPRPRSLSKGPTPAALAGDGPLVAVLSALDAFLGEGIADLPASFAEVTVHRPGDLLEVRDGERVVRGRYAGLSKDGLLRLETETGVTELISGDVTSF